MKNESHADHFGEIQINSDNSKVDVELLAENERLRNELRRRDEKLKRIK